MPCSTDRQGLQVQKHARAHAQERISAGDPWHGVLSSPLRNVKFDTKTCVAPRPHCIPEHPAAHRR